MTVIILTQKILKELLNYNPETGIFSRNIPTKRARVGYEYKTVGNHGYIVINILNKTYTAHRLAWLYIYGEMPSSTLDHINGIRIDNRIANLRVVTPSQNIINTKLRSDNKSGSRGVSWCKDRNKWQAYINIDGKRKPLGRFENKEDAEKAYLEYSINNYGEYIRK